MRYHRLNGAAVATLREAKGISQTELAMRCGVSKAHMSQLESGVKQPSPALAQILARKLGVKFSEIAEPVEAAS